MPAQPASPRLVRSADQILGKGAWRPRTPGPCIQDSHEIGEPLDASLIQDVADVGAHRVLRHCKIVGGFDRRAALKKQRCDRRLARSEAIKAGEQVRVDLRRALRVREGDRDGVRAAERRGGVPGQ